ncbi:hypothetical protein EJ06DRAFT_314790 [Trichodelitschia bisporula]|uniref:Uncharacterized protein n=1 Tax=Trichodelitschia bisporula TaxID=703511 RepID=A0A6G1I4L9_9PEZI|nr:hypothetical protein EJ06DRAFT_314790 [Trichodelitschia bisporula]
MKIRHRMFNMLLRKSDSIPNFYPPSSIEVLDIKTTGSGHQLPVSWLVDSTICCSILLLLLNHADWHRDPASITSQRCLTESFLCLSVGREKLRCKPGAAQRCKSYSACSPHVQQTRETRYRQTSAKLLQESCVS